ncbi:Prefoldin subunit 3 [Umbelopsis sp. PMI_123]|nr:Prefoldin subunit 3 [Umbelopsis sp. PMI_123]
MAQVQTNPRGIPTSPFVERVEDYVSDAEPVEAVLKKFQEAISKYKFMEMNMLQRRKILEEKIPEIQKTLSTVEFLMEKRDGDDDTPTMETEFELNDTLYARAKIEASDTVYLWLGANVMLEYTLEEAQDLLKSKLETAKKSLSNAIEDLDFLRDQITTMEVNTARVYNWDVKQRRLAKAQEGSA